MSAHENIDLAEIEVADSWAQSVTDDLERSRRTAWIIACVSAAIALLLAIALVILLPLKTVEPYTLLVDRQTGNVEALAPLDAQTVTADSALTRSFLVQYVIARESFSAGSFDTDYQKVALWSAGDARQRYMNQMQANNPASPLAFLPRGGTIRTEIKSISSLGADRSLVRFQTTRLDPGARPQAAQDWQAVLSFGYSEAPMSEADRLLNPLGFQVTRYRRNAETLPDPVPAQQAVSSPERAQ
ncbi:virB8 family protein [Qipengyuania sp. DGS5-3]|uniref:virB8 family protein n=1 Tax=Qipengyuania sp. DGS5-3 TaxID=3349632 RepID=UPI0036D285B8